MTPTPSPDTTGPEIGQLAWTPDTIGVPYPQLAACSPGSGLVQSAVVTVAVVDPSGIASVVVLYQRAGDPSPRSVAATLSADGLYRATLSTTDDTPGWYPSAGDPSYVVLLGVEATDLLGNTAATTMRAGFSVAYCQ